MGGWEEGGGEREGECEEKGLSNKPIIPFRSGRGLCGRGLCVCPIHSCTGLCRSEPTELERACNHSQK